jgi:hypothetical protein
MARKSALNYVFCNLLALALTVLLAVAEAEGKGGGQNPNSTTSTGNTSSGSSSSSSSSSSGSKKTKKVKDKNTKITRCYNEQMVEITCPVTKKDKIAGYVVGGIFAVILSFVLYTKVKQKIADRREALEAQRREPGEDDKKVQQMFDQEKDGATKDSDSSDLPPPQYVEKLANGPENGLVPPVRGVADDPDPSESTITPPMISFPIPEPAQPNLSPEPPMTTDTTTERLPMPATTPTRKNALTDRFKNVFRKAKRTAAA